MIQRGCQRRRVSDGHCCACAPPPPPPSLASCAPPRLLCLLFYLFSGRRAFAASLCLVLEMQEPQRTRRDTALMADVHTANNTHPGTVYASCLAQTMTTRMPAYNHVFLMLCRRCLLVLSLGREASKARSRRRSQASHSLQRHLSSLMPYTVLAFCILKSYTGILNG